MVLERLFPDDWLEQKARYAFVLGAGYSLLGIVLSKILFPADPALVAVAFTALLLLPSLSKLFAKEEKRERKEKKFSLKELWKDNQEFIRVYLFLALGIFLVYSLAAIVLPSFQVNQLFREQLEMRGASGGAIFDTGLFLDILINNWWVLLAIFFLSLITGDGAIFLPGTHLYGGRYSASLHAMLPSTRIPIHSSIFSWSWSSSCHTHS